MVKIYFALDLRVASLALEKGPVPERNFFKNESR